ncbi:MAG: hypothetical protein R2706_13395 [Acidimicrobiales bacterium]
MSTRLAFLRLTAATALIGAIALLPASAGAQESPDTANSADTADTTVVGENLDSAADPAEAVADPEADPEADAAAEPAALPDYIYAGFEDEQVRELDAVDQLRLGDDVDRELGVIQVTPGLWMIPFEAVAIGSGVRIAGEISQATLTVPVPQGLTPSSMRATMTLSPDIGSGYIEYSGPGSPVRTLELDGDRFGAGPIEVELDLSRFEVVNDQLRISFRSRLRSEDSSCTTAMIGSYIDLRAGVFLLTGEPEPADTVASFVPHLLENLTIALPDEPTSSEVKLATAFALTATKTAIGHVPTIDIVPFDSIDDLPTPSTSPTDRLVVISHKLDAGLNVVSVKGGPALAIGGNDEQMDKPAISCSTHYSTSPSALKSRSFGPTSTAARRAPDAGSVGAAEEADATGTPLTTTDRLADMAARDKQFSLRDLNITGTKLSGVGRMEMPLSVTQASLGGSVSSVRIYLTGVHTPVEAPASGLGVQLGR